MYSIFMNTRLIKYTVWSIMNIYKGKADEFKQFVILNNV